MAKDKPVTNPDVSALAAVIAALEGLTPEQRLWVMQSAASRFALPGALPAANAHASPAAAAGAAGQTVKEFVRAKQPKTDIQRVACLAYHLDHVEGVAAFKSKELTAQNDAAGGTNFNLPRAVANATAQAKYLAKAGKGNKRLTTLGEDVVSALPNQEKVKEVEQTNKRRKGTRGSKRARNA